MDINECDLGLDNCNMLENCVNTLGSFTCVCKAGFVMTNGKKIKKWTFFPSINISGMCNDKNECKDPNIEYCGQNAECKNTWGSFECNCKSGYEMNALGLCVDVDECDGGNTYCDYD